MRKGDWMQTYSGGRFYPLDPRPEEVNPIDIAHSLSLQCRFGGHVDRFISVAEHCVHMATWVEQKYALHALLHDATEAYVVDVPRPLKRDLIGYKEIEQGVWVAIAERFGISPEIPQQVHEADDRILLTERNALMHNAERWVQDSEIKPLPCRIPGWSSSEAETRYAEALGNLRKGYRITDQLSINPYQYD
jgi:hypothetical protein